MEICNLEGQALDSLGQHIGGSESQRLPSRGLSFGPTGCTIEMDTIGYLSQFGTSIVKSYIEPLEAILIR